MDPNKQEKVRVFNKLNLINIEMNERITYNHNNRRVMWYCKERENLTSLQTSWDLGGQKPKTIYNKGLNFIMENLKKFTKIERIV